MKSIDLLLNRQSNPLLCEPSPSAEHVHEILSAGMRVPDHGGLSPWHFTVVEEEGLSQLSSIFVNAAKLLTDDETKLEKARNMPFRAPMIIVISTQYQEHKVPKQEQLVAAGCAVHAMQMMAYSQGYGAMWRTGDFSYNNSVKYALNIDFKDDIVGFLYIGTEKKSLPLKPVKSYENFVTYVK